MRLTLEEDRETIKRYGHIKPARGWRARLCATRCTGTARTCTLEKGHRGPHAAHGWFKKVVAVWDANDGTGTGGETASRAVKLRARRGLRIRKPAGVLQALWGRVVGTFSSVEDLALLIFFLAFVGFAVHWLILILG